MINGIPRDNPPKSLPEAIDQRVYKHLRYFATYSGTVMKVTLGKILYVASDEYGVPVLGSTPDQWIPCMPENALAGALLCIPGQQVLFRFIDGSGHRAVYVGHDPYYYTPLNSGEGKYVLFESADSLTTIYFDQLQNKIILKNGVAEFDLSSLTGAVLQSPKIDMSSTTTIDLLSVANTSINALQIHLNGSSKSFVTYEALNIALQALITAINLTFASKLNGGGSPGALVLDISAAQTLTVKTSG